MNKLILAAFMASSVAITAVSAQEVDYDHSAHGAAGHGDVTVSQQAERAGHSSGLYTWSAYSRNIGAASTVTGQAQSAIGRELSGNPEVPGAPAASKSWN